jgi:hypothetical protein
MHDRGRLNEGYENLGNFHYFQLNGILSVLLRSKGRKFLLKFN